jgi:hypothetical protein
MSTGVTTLPFFVKVEGQAYSNHRSPRGVWGVEVKAEKSLAHSACAALAVARDMVPFLNENREYFTLRVYKEDGQEVVVPRSLVTHFEEEGRFTGRAKAYPEEITFG